MFPDPPYRDASGNELREQMSFRPSVRQRLFDLVEFQNGKLRQRENFAHQKAIHDNVGASIAIINTTSEQVIKKRVRRFQLV